MKKSKAVYSAPALMMIESNTPLILLQDEKIRNRQQAILLGKKTGFSLLESIVQNQIETVGNQTKSISWGLTAQTENRGSY
ncbi:hypothetical protein LEP1GSC185_2007 [Leptospira licerasiae serovar Varillal str. VAR 010]|uniref:Uncharacterized protein n=1 Tax=Leptospira licerasiae str. MMD4847 TaxID=1049971 RepID=A0ABN0H4L9_9LEPT|nr:hypothetical protein LEP1GSC185_2007 [Leptospira licerasiae serovar Varillal str. VAR 010]EJZ40542.1 hypothetical protein LEP1GSC178_1273 [Leptospira licerasiae str. MMD4847]